MKFTEKGQVILDVNYHEADKNRPYLELIVEDTGIGIPKDKFETIFEHFSRNTPSYQGIYKGSGLGLYTVKRYLEVLNGKVQVESEVDKGSRFIVTIPIRKADQPTDEEKAFSSHFGTIPSSPVEKHIQPASGRSQFSHNKARILLVEDQLIAAQSAIYLLQKLHCHVDHATSGEDAVKMVEKNQYDLIFMDIGLPRMDGLETTRQIRSLSDSQKAHTPIIGLSAHAIEKKKNECLQAGMQSMVTKPLTLVAAEELIGQYVLTPDDQYASIKQEENHLPAIDIRQGVHLMEGDEELARHFITLLAKTLPEDKEKIKAAYEQSRWEDVQALLHKVNGGLAYCGVPKLQQATTILYEAVEKKQADEIAKAFQVFNRATEQFLAACAQAAIEAQ